MTQRRNTHQRELVREAVCELGVHPTAAQVYEYVHDRDEKVSLATVYRNLNLLAEQGVILAVDTASGRHYDHRTDDHGHLICTECGTMVDISLPYETSIDNAASKATGFSGVHHRIVFEGICPTCTRPAGNSDAGARS